MSRLTDRLERDLGQIAADADPSPSAWASIVARLGEDGAADDALVLAPASNRPKYRAWITAAAAAFVVIAGAIAVLSRAGDDSSTTPVDQSPTTTFESPRHGYSVQYPDGAVVTPATTFLGHSVSEEDNGVDVVETASGAVFTGGSLEDPGPGVFPTDDWPSIDEYIDDSVLDGGCGAPRSQQEEITIDGQSGRIAECANEIVATVVAGGRIYRFTLLHGGRDTRANFDTFADTIRLTPETADDIPPLTDGPFVSPTNGFSIMYFDRGEGTLRPATAIWDPGNQQIEDNQFDDGVDVVETGLAAIFMGSSAEIPDEVSVDEWVDEYVSPGDGCGGPRSQQEEITIDGQPGRVAECVGSTKIVATVVAGTRLYLFTLGHDGRDDAREFFDRWAATIDLTPETALPPWTTTFVSPSYGYAMGAIDRGGIVPATEPWDPANQQINVDFDDRFDAVETGYAAYFEAASTPIPDGVTIDEWVDEYVTPVSSGGCGVPRSEQEEITIDGEAARAAECHEIQATVVAGGRLYLFMLGADRSDARAFFDAWIATIDLTPETAATP